MATYDEGLREYIVETFAAEDETLRWVRERTQEHGLPAIYINPEEGRFLQLLIHICGAEKAVEVGTLGGYSGIWIARALPAHGKLITLEKRPDHAAVARDHFANSDVADRVEVRVGDAHHLLRNLADDGPYDFMFVDAEKAGYEAYFDWGLANVRVGGILAFHNAFRGGKVIDPPEDDAGTHAIHAFNQRVAVEPRITGTIYPAGDGTVIAVKVA